MIEQIRIKLGALFAFGLGGIAFYCAGFGQFPPAYYRSLAVLAATAIVLLSKPLPVYFPHLSRALRSCLSAVDLAMFMVVAGAIYYFISIADDAQSGMVIVSTFQSWIGFLAILVLLELTRRVFGLPIVIVTAIALLFALYGNFLPGFFRHRGFGLGHLVEHLWYSFFGIFGLPTAVILDFVLVFVVFGTILEGTGAGERLLKIVFVLTGWTRGGPAHAAVWSSCLFGTMSGSVIANVVGTGTFTIPMIKQRGFSAKFAGAVEASASSGGQLMPPVMGAAAFLMAELTGIPYAVIAVAALVPALFFYGSIFASVAVEARKLGIQAVPKSERPKLTREDWIMSIQFVGPILAMIVIMVSGRSTAAAGFFATLVAIGLAFLNPSFRKQPHSQLFRAFANGGTAGAALLVSAGALGAIIGTMDMTGLGIKFANMVLLLSESNLFLALIMTMFACILLGMGMPTLPAYLVIVLVMGPAIGKFGIPEIAVHLFVMYYGVLSNITPPVAIAAYAAAPIAGANPTSIGLTAVRITFVGFVVPFVFVYEPALLIVAGDFDLMSFLYVAFRLSLAIWLFATGTAFFDRSELSKMEGALRVGLALVVLFAGHIESFFVLGAVALGLALIAYHYVRTNALPVNARAG